MRPILLRPKSRGAVTLQSKDPREAPLVDVAYLTHPDDVATLVEGEQDGQRWRDWRMYAEAHKGVSGIDNGTGSYVGFSVKAS